MARKQPLSFWFRRILGFFYADRSIDNPNHYAMLFERVATALDRLAKINPAVLSKFHPRCMSIIKAMERCDMHRLVVEVTQLYTILLFLESMDELASQKAARVLYRKFPELLKPYRNDVYLFSSAPTNHNPSEIRYRDLMEKARLYSIASRYIDNLKNITKPTFTKIGIVFTFDGYVPASVVRLLKKVNAERLFSYYWYAPSMTVVACPDKYFHNFVNKYYTLLKRKGKINSMPKPGSDSYRHFMEGACQFITDKCGGSDLNVVSDVKFYSSRALWVVLPCSKLEANDRFRLHSWDLFFSTTFNKNKQIGV